MFPQISVDGFSAETLESVRKALGEPAGRYLPGSGLIQKDITTATGLVAYNLEAPSKLLVPVITPLRNRLPRPGTGKGTAANWKVITSLNTNRTDPFTAEGTKAATINYAPVDKSAAYKTISKGDNVTFQAQWAGKTFEDVRANGGIRLLKNVMILEEMALLGGRNAALGAVTTPTLVTASSGGAIGAGTYNVICRAMTNLGRGRKSSAATTSALSGSTNTISASVPWVEGATHYEWYVGTSTNERLEAVTQINSMALTALAGTGALASAVTDDSADSLAFDGFIAQLTPAVSQVRTLATGTNGVGTKVTLTDIDDVLQNIWDTSKGDPDVIVVNAEQSRRITALILKSNGGPTQFMTTSGDKATLVGGYRATHYISPVTGKVIEILTHPHLRAGTILFLSLSMPFADSSIDAPIEVETRQEYMLLEYPVTSPKWEFEVMVDEVLKIYFAGGCGVIRNCNTEKTDA